MKSKLVGGLPIIKIKIRYILYELGLGGIVLMFRGSHNYG